MSSNNARSKIMKCFDVCCGAGIFSLGFKKAGFTVLGGIDKDSHAIETAKKNIPEALWELIPIEDFAKNIPQRHNHPVFNADVIIAGLPCQGFSVAGKCEPDDHRNKLYKYLVKIVKIVKPQFVVIENVKGLLSERNRKIFFDLLNRLEKSNYDVGYRLYDAVNFGVPQFRKRVFIVASLKIPARYVFEGMRFSNKRLTVKDALKCIPPKIENPATNHTFMVHSKKVEQKIEKIKDNRLISYRRLKWDSPSVTIISGHNALPLHPHENRAISNREAARLQGIPDNFILTGPRTEQTVQVANVVPLPLATKIAKAIIKSHKLIKSCRKRLYASLISKTDKKFKNRIRKYFIKYYQDDGRKYPWRDTNDPYKILISEVLLQRTRSDMVNGVWKKMIGSIKTSRDGFDLNEGAMIDCIKKIGIFNRIKTIKLLNSSLTNYFGKRIPTHFDELNNLPGVGIYIAAAIRTFAFGIPDFPVDSNSFRFISRFFGTKIYGKKTEARQIREFMDTIIDQKKPKEFVYGFLDFCASICLSGKPKCDICFLNDKCAYCKL